MKKLFYPVLIAASVLSFNAWAEDAVTWKGSAGWGMDSQYNSIYNPKEIETMKGEIVSLGRFVPKEGMPPGVQILLKTTRETIPVHLGPEWFMENQDVKLEPNNNVEVQGSRVSYNGKQTIMASRITKGDMALALRDRFGAPIWSGWRKR